MAYRRIALFAFLAASALTPILVAQDEQHVALDQLLLLAAVGFNRQARHVDRLVGEAGLHRQRRDQPRDCCSSVAGGQYLAVRIPHSRRDQNDPILREAVPEVLRDRGPHRVDHTIVQRAP